jgi:hypothetical protein
MIFVSFVALNSKERNMKDKMFFAGILSVALVFGMTVMGCDNGSTDDSNNPTGPTAAEQFAQDSVLSGKVSVSGNTVTLNERVTIPAGSVLTIPSNIILSAKMGNGLIIGGILQIEAGASLELQAFSGFGSGSGGTGRIYKGSTTSAEGLTATVSGSASGNGILITSKTNGYDINKSASGNTTKAIIGNLGITASKSSLTAAISNETPPTAERSIQTGTGTILTIKNPDTPNNNNNNNNGDSNNTSPVITALENGGQVYESDYSTPYTGSGTIKIRLGEYGSYTYVDVGTVSAGKVTLNLPATLDSKYLDPVYTDDTPTGITVSPSDVMSESPTLRMFEGTAEKGTLDLRKETQTVQDRIAYMYFSKACSITGTNNDHGGTITWQINGKAGWNRVYLNANNTTGKYTTDLSGVPSDLKWVFNPK